MIAVEVRVDTTLSRRERKKLETRQALLEVSLALFREKGFQATTVEEITERADVAKGTFFNYFASKEALLDDLSVWHVGRLRAVLDVSQGAPASPVARIKLLMRLTHEQVVQDIRLFRRAFAHNLRHPPPPPHGGKRELFGFLAELVEEAQACGEIRADVEAGLVADLLRMAYFRWIIAGCDDGRVQVPAAQLEQVLDLLMEGLAGPEWGNG
jgi:AcrR family transcriptional regulator